MTQQYIHCQIRKRHIHNTSSGWYCHHATRRRGVLLSTSFFHRRKILQMVCFFIHYANIAIFIFKLSLIKLRSRGQFELWTQPLTTYPSCTSDSATAESDSRQRAANTLTVLLLLEGRLSVSCQWCEAGGSAEYFDLLLTVMSSSGSFT